MAVYGSVKVLLVHYQTAKGQEMNEEVTEKMLFIGLRKDIKVMERKEKHGTISLKERGFLKAWKKQLQKGLDNAPNAL